MNVAFVSIVWAFLQIGALCLFSLSIAWLLRGRKPQWVTAILAGTCVATLLLALIAIVPTWQWTLVVDNRTQAGAKYPQSIEQLAYQTANEARQDATKTMPCDAIVTTLGPTRDTGEVDSRHVDTLIAIRQFLSRALQSVDHEVRLAEDWQQPIVAARNYSVGFVLICGLLVMSLLWCSSWLYVRRIIATSQAIEDESILSLVASHARAFGLKSVLTVRESRHVPIGATVGWYRVTVLLHSDWREWSEQERSAVIAHELAHASRHDFVWVVVASWTRILLFFHPMVHALIQRLRMEQELAADQLAAGKVGNAKAYGRALASLALRSQQSLGTSNPKLGSMLAAGQICVTRRVMMLKQGSLKPVPSRSRWSMAIVVAIACSAIPIAGLRGTTQEPTPEQSLQERDVQGPVAPALPKPTVLLSDEFLAAYPPLEFKGSMAYRPGRFRAGEFGPEAAWVQDWFAVSLLGKPMPDNAKVYGQGNLSLRWNDEERKHGRMDLTASFREGESTLPGQLTQFANIPSIFGAKPMRTVTTHQTNGRTIFGVTNSPTNDKPEKWLVDDEQGYFLGTQEEVESYVRGQSFALESIPEHFREDYRNAAFAMVFSDCEQWRDKLESHAKGSAREAEFRVALPLTQDVKQIGFFVDGCRSPACSIRATVTNTDAAQRLAIQAKALIEIGKIAMLASKQTEEKAEAEFEMVNSILETMKITAQGSEVVLQFDILVPSFENGSAFAYVNSIVGWQSLEFNSLPIVQASDVPFVEVSPNEFGRELPGLFSQTLDATDYRGKTVSLQMDIKCYDPFLDQAGAFLWASRHEEVSRVNYGDRKPLKTGSRYTGHRMLAAKTNACDGVSPLRKALETVRVIATGSQDATWRTVSVEIDVPEDAEHLSLGCYTKNATIQMRNVRFQTTDRSGKALPNKMTGHDALADMPYNILIVPGYEIRKEPINLNLQATSAEPIRAASQSDAVVR